MSKHAATPSFKTKAEEYVEERMKQLTGRREPLPGNGRRRLDIMQAQA